MHQLICLISVCDKTEEQAYNEIYAAILKFKKWYNLIEQEENQLQSSLMEEEIQLIMKQARISREEGLQ